MQYARTVLFRSEGEKRTSARFVRNETGNHMCVLQGLDIKYLHLRALCGKYESSHFYNPDLITVVVDIF